MAPRADEVRRHRPEDLGEDLAVLAGSVVPKVISAIGQGISDGAVLVLIGLIVVRMGCSTRERVGAIVCSAELRRDETEVLWVPAQQPLRGEEDRNSPL